MSELRQTARSRFEELGRAHVQAMMDTAALPPEWTPFANEWLAERQDERDADQDARLASCEKAIVGLSADLAEAKKQIETLAGLINLLSEKFGSQETPPQQTA